MGQLSSPTSQLPQMHLLFLLHFKVKLQFNPCSPRNAQLCIPAESPKGRLSTPSNSPIESRSFGRDDRRGQLSPQCGSYAYRSQEAEEQTLIIVSDKGLDDNPNISQHHDNKQCHLHQRPCSSTRTHISFISDAVPTCTNHYIP